MARMVIFSAVTGEMLHAGTPVAGAPVEHEFHWPSEDAVGNDRIFTGAGGDFDFAKIRRSSLLGSLLPHKSALRQSLTVHPGGQTYAAWLQNQHHYHGGEVEGPPLRPVCRLDSCPGRQPGGYGGICGLE